jgi:hypothetical protein
VTFGCWFNVGTDKVSEHARSKTGVVQALFQCLVEADMNRVMERRNINIALWRTRSTFAFYN